MPSASTLTPAVPVAPGLRVARSLWPLAVAPVITVATIVALEKIYPLLELGPAGDDSLYGLVYVVYAIVMTPLLLLTLGVSLWSLTRRRPVSLWTVAAVTMLYAAATSWLVGISFTNDPQTYTPASIASYESALTWVLIAELSAFVVLLAAAAFSRRGAEARSR